MDVLFSYPFCGLGGVETVLVNRASGLRTMGVAADVALGVQYGDGGRWLSQESCVQAGATVAELAKLVVERPYDVVVAVDHPELVVALREVRFRGTVVFETHTAHVDAARRFYTGLDPEVVQHVVVPAAFTAKSVQALSRTSLPVTVVPSPIDLERFAPRRPEETASLLPDGVQAPVILGVGRLEREKNPLGLLGMVCRLLDRGVSLHTILIGDAPHDAAYRDLIYGAVPERLAAHVDFIPMVAPSAMPLYYSLAASSGGCLVSTSRAESLPMTILEAAACECATLAADVGGIAEFVRHGVTGWLFDVDDPDSACEMLEEVLAGDGLRAAGREARRAAAASHSADKACAQYASLLRSAVEAKRSAGVTHRSTPSVARMAPRDVRVMAIIAAYNEEDIIGETIRHLVEDGIDVYFIDNCSTDGTAAVAEQWLGRGVVAIEVFPRTAGNAELLDWRAILDRKLQVGDERPADWYIHHDADEIREGPWPGTSLREAIGFVDRLGYNAIDFRVLNFRPVDETFAVGIDPAEHFTHYEEGEEYDALQVKCWKRQDDRVELALSGGHDVTFEGRRVFPIQFLLRHYPIRSAEHGARKVLRERKPRFRSDERELGWHVQYDIFDEGSSFKWAALDLIRYDPDQVRCDLMLSGQARASAAVDSDAAAADAEETPLS